MTQDRMRQSLKRETQAFHFESGEVKQGGILGGVPRGWIEVFAAKNGSKCLLRKIDFK